MGILNQPLYRRPSWARNPKVYRLYMRTDLAKNRHPGDYGLDNFSYDAGHLSKFEVPPNVLNEVPDILSTTVAEWQLAGAAICTSLDRIKLLDDESIYRGYPDKSGSQHLSRSASNVAAATGPGASMSDTPPMASPDIASYRPSPKLSTANTQKTPFDGVEHRRPEIGLGMESPPFTPLDSQVCSTPEMLPPATRSAMPDVHALSRQLSPISTRSRVDSAVSSFNKSFPTGAVFDEAAWDIYLNSYRAELNDIKTTALPRFKGRASLIERLAAEMGTDPGWKNGIATFMLWWASIKPKIAEYEACVKDLDLPTIEYVRLERTARGMPT
jgi:hypothetical protein